MRKMRNTPLSVAALVVATALMSGRPLVAAPPPVPPDLTQTSTVDRTLTYNLGATGLRGWVYTQPANFFESVQGRTTTASRQILVTHVGARSPADGVMKVDDVILGAGGKLFSDNARIMYEALKSGLPDIFAAVKTPCLADTMFGNEIRMGGFKALTKYHFKEGIEAGVIFAKTHGGHGSESRSGEIMKQLVRYGTAAREAVPALKELIVALNDQCKKGEFPAGELNNRRVAAVEEAIKAIEAATTQPELRSIAPRLPKANRGQ